MVITLTKAINKAPFDQLYPYRSHFLKRGALRYHYLDEGRGEPMLMVHGNPTWSFYYRSLINAFSHDHRVIVPDHMGCGLSDKPDFSQYDFSLKSRVADLTALMDHLNLERPLTLIVHDWGGMIGLAWALENLEKVGRIVIMNTAGFFPPQGKPIPKRLKLIRQSNALMNHAVLRLNLFARAALYMAPQRRLSPKVKAGLIAPYNSARNRLATLKFVQDIPLSPRDPSGPIVDRVEKNLDKIGMYPTLILWGTHDFVFDQNYYQEWRRRLPAAKAYLFNDAGHYLLEDIPFKIVSKITEFLHKHPCG